MGKGERWEGREEVAVHDTLRLCLFVLEYEEAGNGDGVLQRP